MESLKPLDKISTPDGRWEAFHIDLESLYKITKAMSLSEEVPEYPAIQFQQAQHLLIYSHLQFSLLSVALTQAVIAVECAIKTRWRNSPSGLKKSPYGLKKLLEHAFREKWIEGFSQNLTNILPTLRNASAHGQYTLDPIGTLELVKLCGEVIQQLFSPPSKCL
jgi:hypothetical protein